VTPEVSEKGRAVTKFEKRGCWGRNLRHGVPKRYAKSRISWARKGQRFRRCRGDGYLWKGKVTRSSADTTCAFHAYGKREDFENCDRRIKKGEGVGMKNGPVIPLALKKTVEESAKETKCPRTRRQKSKTRKGVGEEGTLSTQARIFKPSF